MIYKIEIEENGNWTDYTYATRLSFPLAERRDLGFDSSQIVLECIDRETIFLPYTRVKITVDSKVFRFFVTSPQTPQVIYGTSVKYTHTLPLIELTKYVEVVFADTSTITQNLKGIYTGNFTLSNITYGGGFPDDIGQLLFNISDPLFIGNNILYIPAKEDIVITKNPDGFLDATITSDFGTVDFNSYISILTAGTYHITINVEYTYLTLKTGSITYEINVLDEITKQATKTISSELQRTVNIAEICRESIDHPRFVIDPLILAKYNDVPCPEFSMTRQTLWEKMLEFGNYIHAIPRLISDENENWNVITFDFLGKQDLAINDGVLSYKEKSFNIDNYATEIDSQVDNISNVDNEDEGSLIDPAENIFKTVRTEENTTEITDDNGFFATEKGISKLLKVECRYDGVVYDITKFCYETYEYNCLSSYQSIYPYSKAYALQYSLGNNNITQLQHKNENLIGTVFENWAIVNILKSLGATIPLVTVGLVINLEYRIEYVPFISTRLKQTKVNANDFNTKATLVYNQSANAVNSNSYGENMKGAILMYGNEESVENYYTNVITKIPQIGTIVGDKYISAINYEFYKDFIKYSIEYSKNFNRLSGFVGVKSNVRMYEISERQVYNRNPIYSSQVTIGNYDTTKQHFATIVKYYGRISLANTFNQTVNDESDPSIAILRTFDKNENVLQTVGLPLNTFGLGNSLIFTCKFADNYSAGNKAVRGQVTNKLIQDYVPYTDSYGEVKNLAFTFTTPYPTNTEIFGLTVADKLPEIRLVTTGFQEFPLHEAILSSEISQIPSTQFLTNNGALQIYKDSREAITLTVQIDFLTNDNDIILGYGLTHTNQLVCSSFAGKPVKVYAMDRKIGQFEQKVDLTNATLIKTFDTTNVDTDWIFGDGSGVDILKPYMQMKPITTTVNSESLAFIDDDGNLVMAVNKKKNAGETYDTIYFNFK